MMDNKEILDFVKKYAESYMAGCDQFLSELKEGEEDIKSFVRGQKSACSAIINYITLTEVVCIPRGKENV